MEPYVSYFGIVILLVLLIYLFLAHEEIRLWKKIIIFGATVGAAIFVYYGARDIMGRATPFVPPGQYVISSIHLDPDTNRVFVFITEKEDDPKFQPRLFVLPKDEFAQTNDEIEKMLELQRKGVKILFNRKIKYGNKNKRGSQYEHDISPHDPLGNISSPKKK